MYLLFFLISFLASIAGAICGIGGGVIIKPLLDATGVMSVSAISFLSGCTVLTMSAVSIGGSLRKSGTKLHFRRVLPLAIGAAAGGLVGKAVFQQIRDSMSSENLLGLIQAVTLLFVTALTFLYTVLKKKVHTLHVQNLFVCVCVGLGLGFLSSFLGIGGGPINLMILSFFFSMGTKDAAMNSLFIILVSQMFSLFQTIMTGSVPSVELLYLILMVIGGILGGKLGGQIQKRINDKHVTALFEFMMIIIMAINVYNITKFLN